MSPTACDRCQRIAKTSAHSAGGASEHLCKVCGKNAELESLSRAPAGLGPDVVLFGCVVSTLGSVQGVSVGVQELGEWTLTDAKGFFNLKGILSRWALLALEELFELLYNQDPVSPEAWLRKALADGCLPGTYEPLLRRSDIGAVLDRSTFVSMAAGPDAIASLAPRIFPENARRRSMSLCFVKEGFAPTFLAVDVLAQLSSPGVGLRVCMPALGASAVVDPAAGGQVRDEVSGASVGLLPGTSLVHADGTLYHGAVTVSLAVIDASDPKSLEAMPGDFSGFTVEGGAAQIQSFGALWVGLFGEGAASPQLQLAETSPGMELNLFSDAPVNFGMLGVPPTIWEFDASTSKWKQDAMGSLAVDGVPLPPAGKDPFAVGPPGAAEFRPRAKGKAKAKKMNGGGEFHAQNHYDFLDGSPTWTPEAYGKFFGKPGKKAFTMTNIKRAGYWNCDAPCITTFICGRLVDAAGQAIVKANVWSVGKNYAGASPRSGVDEDGRFSILAQCLSDIEVYAILPSGGDEAPSRFKLGAFTTGPPGEMLDLGDLAITSAKRSSTPPPKPKRR